MLFPINHGYHHIWSFIASKGLTFVHNINVGNLFAKGKGGFYSSELSFLSTEQDCLKGILNSEKSLCVSFYILLAFVNSVVSDWITEIG